METDAAIYNEKFSTADWQHRFETWHAAQPNSDGSHDVGHFRRVWQNCQLLRSMEADKPDAKILLAAAYFHDLINPPKDSPDRSRASQLSADAAQDMLQEWIYPLSDDEFANLHHTITVHSFSANLPAETLEAKLFQDADRLEALGAIGLARMFCVTGQLGRSLWDQNDPLAAHRELDEKSFGIDHIETKLRRVANMMQTASGHAIAKERMTYIDQFRAQLLAEIDPLES